MHVWLWSSKDWAPSSCSSLSRCVLFIHQPLFDLFFPFILSIYFSCCHFHIFFVASLFQKGFLKHPLCANTRCFTCFFVVLFLFGLFLAFVFWLNQPPVLECQKFCFLVLFFLLLLLLFVFLSQVEFFSRYVFLRTLCYQMCNMWNVLENVSGNSMSMLSSSVSCEGPS